MHSGTTPAGIMIYGVTEKESLVIYGLGEGGGKKERGSPIKSSTIEDT